MTTKPTTFPSPDDIKARWDIIQIIQEEQKEIKDCKIRTRLDNIVASLTKSSDDGSCIKGQTIVEFPISTLDVHFLKCLEDKDGDNMQYFLNLIPGWDFNLKMMGGDNYIRLFVRK
jgi:hypothetical protein